MPSLVLRMLAALVLAAVAAVATPASVACACDCASVDTEQAMAQASAVFDGTVVAASQPSGGSSAELIEYTVEVSRVFKGEVAERVIVRSAASSVSCGVELKGDVTVFAYGAEDQLETGLCSVPVDLDRSALGEGHEPALLGVASPVVDTGPVVVAAVAGLLVLAGFSVWMVRRTR